MSEYPGALDFFVPQSLVFQGAQPQAAIVIHKTAGFTSAQDVARYFQSGAGGRNVSAHFVVGQDGVICQCVSLHDGAGANCCLEPGHDRYWDQFVGTNLNLVTISIEHVDPTLDNSTPLTGAQKLASFSLVQWIMKQTGISVIKGHNSIDPISRARCPGNYPLQELIAFTRGGSMTVPQGWKDDGNVLTAPNGHKVVHGMRDFVLGNNWDPTDLPLTEEVWSSQVDMWDSQSGSGSNQVFTYDSLRYTSKDGVTYGQCGRILQAYLVHANSLAQEVQQLQQQVKDLQAGLPAADINNALTSIQQLVKDLTALVQ